MSLSFAGYPTANYIGTPYSMPIQIATKGGKIVPLTFDWQAYGVGDDLPALAVTLNLSTAVGSPCRFCWSL